MPPRPSPSRRYRRPLSDDPLAWLLGLERLGMKFGLDNMMRLTSELGHPERTFASIHIAGTNGKGSVTAMLEAALHASGHRSARYTSPHLERLEERFVIGAVETDTASLHLAIEEVRDVVRRTEAGSEDFQPTFFECATVSAFVLFRSKGVEAAVLETGLGGRLDATNVVQPIATAITSISLDHQAYLGDTLQSIAREKAGIIKPGVPVVIGPLPPDAEREIARIALERGAPLRRGRDVPGVRPALRGEHQRDNIAVTAALADVLTAGGLPIADTALRHAIEHVDWPARLEHFVRGDHEILLDAAHNPAGARALATYLGQSAWTNATLVFGAMADKDAEGMLRELTPGVAAVVCTTAPSPRAESARHLAEVARTMSRDVYVEEDPERAVAQAKALSRRIVIAGSIFLVGPLRGILR